MKKYRLIPALAAACVLTGCGAPAATTVSVPEPVTTTAAEPEKTEPAAAAATVPEVTTAAETTIAETAEEETADEPGEEDHYGNDDTISLLQRNGQLVYGDEFCQIRYFGDMRADNGELIIVLGYSKFHGGLVRLNTGGFYVGDIVDWQPLWLSDMNSFTDGYWYHSGAHGWEFYDGSSDQPWWTDNEFIYLRYPHTSTLQENDDDMFYSEYANITEGEFVQYDDSDYDGTCSRGLWVYDLQIQEANDANYETREASYFEEPTEENTHTCTSDYDADVIVVPFDPDKVELWAHI